ncbi:MAG: glycosyltransferase family 61 protein [Methylacidiphilales bacterium]|nr:glycosyltransferase family 61 protein [Candidatus Methylacidiphilales bacterium]
MNQEEGRIPPLKRLAAQIARVLPPSWRFPVCGVSASVCGPEATQPLPPEAFVSPDPRFLKPVSEFLDPAHLSPLALVQSHLVAVPRGIAWSRGAHLTADGRLIDPLSVGMNFPMDYWLVKRQRFFPKIDRVPGTVISLTTDGHNNYYHWMLDVLPKLFIALAAGLGRGTFYLGASTPFQKQTLELLGIPPSRVIDCNTFRFLQADELIVPFLGQRHPPNVFNAGKCRLLADVFSFLLAAKPSSEKLPTRFIVSRGKTRSRRVVNEAELVARLEPLGFRPIYLEDLSLAEQITLFARAEAIVASTGAGLVNLVHTRPGVPVAILMPEECPDLVCRDIAAFARLRCEIFYAQRHPPETTDKIGCDMTLDAQLLDNIVRHFAP